MIRKDIEYIDYNGEERIDTCWFNLSKSEVLEMQLTGADGGLYGYVRRIMQSDDNEKIIQVFKDLILRSYGEKDVDGKHFMKSEELRNRFECSAAYTELFIELSTDAKKAAEFFVGITPAGLDEVADRLKNLPDVDEDQVSSMIETAMAEKIKTKPTGVIPMIPKKEESVDIDALVEARVQEALKKKEETKSTVDIDALVEARVQEALKKKEETNEQQWPEYMPQTLGTPTQDEQPSLPSGEV